MSNRVLKNKSDHFTSARRIFLFSESTAGERIKGGRPTPRPRPLPRPRPRPPLHPPLPLIVLAAVDVLTVRLTTFSDSVESDSSSASGSSLSCCPFFFSMADAETVELRRVVTLLLWSGNCSKCLDNLQINIINHSQFNFNKAPVLAYLCGVVYSRLQVAQLNGEVGITALAGSLESSEESALLSSFPTTTLGDK